MKRRDLLIFVKMSRSLYFFFGWFCVRPFKSFKWESFSGINILGKNLESSRRQHTTTTTELQYGTPPYDDPYEYIYIEYIIYNLYKNIYSNSTLYTALWTYEYSRNEILYYNTYIQTALQNESGGQAGGGKFNKNERGGVWAEMKGGAVPIYLLL